MDCCFALGMHKLISQRCWLSARDSCSFSLALSTEACVLLRCQQASDMGGGYCVEYGACSSQHFLWKQTYTWLSSHPQVPSVHASLSTPKAMNTLAHRQGRQPRMPCLLDGVAQAGL